MSEVPAPQIRDTSAVDARRAERRARMGLARLTEPAGAAVRDEVDAHGAVAAFERLRSGQGPLAERLRRRADEVDPEADERATRWCDARVLIPGDAEWPVALDELDAPPLCLWVRGPADLAELVSRSVAIVGARGATAYGTRVAAEMAFGVGVQGWTVVSGAAFGIDAAAHRGALAADAPTVAALACGVDRAYPAAHTELLGQILRTGLVLTEVPPGSSPLPSRFLARNRLIAALTQGTVVVEAGLRSGSLNTAGWADGLVRPVGAVPGPVTSTASAGTNERIRLHQAELVTDADDVLELVGRMGEHLTPVRREPDRPGDGLAAEARAVWEALSPRAGRSVDRLAADAGLTGAEVQAALASLEVDGLARPGADGWRRS